jgi:hypothetical protein
MLLTQKSAVHHWFGLEALTPSNNGSNLLVVMQVAIPPPIPEFQGDYTPDSTRAQRLRFTYTKSGDAVFVGHLDLMKVQACLLSPLV